MPLSREELAYVDRFLPGSGHITELTLLDRLLRYANEESVLQYTPTNGVDRMAANYIKSRVIPSVRFRVERNIPPPYSGLPAEGTSGIPTTFGAGEVYIVISQRKWRHRPGTQVSEVVPELYVYGDSEVIGAHLINLDESAPGDKPCRDYCQTAEEAFAAIQGRLDLIIRNISRSG